MAMDAAAKARLKAAAEKKRAETTGRNTLAGLDRNLGMVALDNVQDRWPDLPGMELFADGELWYDLHDNGGKRLRVGDNWLTRIRCQYDDPPRPGYAKVYPGGILCPWVRLSYAPEWLKDALAAREWPTRKIMYWVRGVPITAPVFPTAVVVAWFRFLWPETAEWCRRAAKYFTGYTESYIQRHPGVGARIKLTAVRTVFGPAPIGSEWIVSGSDGGRPIIPWSADGFGGGAFTMYPGMGDAWEVIG